MRAIFFALILVNAAAASEVVATRLDGRTARGELADWNEELAILETTDGEQRVPIKELLSLRWPADPSDAETDGAASSIQVELTDGSVLPIDEFRSNASRVNITLAGRAEGQADSLQLHKRQVAAVRLQPLDAALREQWNDIREMKPASDVIVLLKREGQSLDYVECVLGDVTTEQVEFELDGDDKKVDRTNIAGFIYFRRDAAKQDEPRLVVRGRGGLNVNAAEARLRDHTIQLTTAGGTKFDWPLDDILIADFSAGKIVYLSDLKPAAKTTTPLIALPEGAKLAGKYTEPRPDHSAYGGPLTLAAGDELTTAPSAQLQSFTKGLAIRSRTELIYRLPAGYRRLRALAGIDPATRASGNVHVEILGDDEPLFSAEVSGTDPPRAIDVDIAGTKQLKVVIGYGKNLDTGDWLNLCDLRLVK